MLQARNIWDLIVARADDTPDREMAVDETGRRLTFGEYRDRCERAAAGLAALGVGDGTVVSWEQPTTLESMVLFGALRRLGAVQNPMLPIYREREVGFIIRQTGSTLLIVPSAWKGFDYEAMAADVTAGTDDRGAGQRPLAARRRPVDPAPAADDDMHVPTGEPVPVRWLFYTSGTTADAEGRPHTATAR